MRFSVIIPVYNVEAYLAECLESILNQTYQDFEIILIDDGSRDKSGQICENYASQHLGHIKVRHQENQGLVKTRVTGLNIASGEICLFVDSDDALRLDALEVINETFEKTGCDLALYGASRDAEFVNESYMLSFEKGTCFEGVTKKELLTYMITSGKMNSISMKAAKKTVYEAFLDGYDIDVDITNGEDLHLSMPVITHAKKLVWTGEKLYFYRPREGSMVNSFCPGLHRSVKNVRMEMEKYIDLWEIPECYPAFYARVVYNWIHALKELLKHQTFLTKAERGGLLVELAQDEFFRKSYENMQPGYLCRRDSLLARWLYREKFLSLRLIGRGFMLLKKF